MAYIGVSPQNGVRKKHTYTASGSQTSFTGAGAEGITLSYKDSNFVDVYQNGVKLAEADYTSTSGTAIVLDQGAAANDIVEIIVYDVFSTSDMVSASDGGTFAGNVAMSGTLTLTGNGDFNGDLDVDGTLEADAITVNGTALNTVIAGVTVANATLAATATVTDSNANTNFPIVFHDESNALLDDTGALRYNPSTGELLVPKLTVAGTTTTVDTVTMNAANAVVFEGATADAHETTLTIVDPTADRTINLPNVSGTIPVLAAASNTAITSTPDELNLLDGITAGTVSASLAVVADSNKDITGFRNITTTGVVTSNAGVVVDNITIDGTEIDLSSGNLTLDIDGQLVINSDSGQIVLQDDTVNWGNFQNSSGDFIIGSLGADKDIIFQGLDGSSTITALTLDMSDGGRAAFAHNADFVDGRGIRLGDGNDFQLYHDGSNSYIQNSTNNIIIDNTASDQDIIFKVNDGGSSTETARFDASFDAFVLRDGGGAAVSAGKLEINASGSSYNLIALKTTRTSTGTNFIEFFNSSGTNAGEINHNGSTTVNYSTSSDYRLKENVTYDFDATSRLKQLKPARFNFIADPDVTMDGFLAHEVQSIVPIAVNGDKDEIKKWNKEEIERGFAPDGASEGDNKLDDDGNPIPKYQGIDNSHLVPLLTKALQEQQATIETLTARITALESA